MECVPLNSIEELQGLCSKGERVLILKHNNQCPISKGVLSRLEVEEAGDPAKVHVIDLHAHRELSNEVASRYGVPHQSPQLLVIQQDRCTYHQWGYDISGREALKETEPSSGK